MTLRSPIEREPDSSLLLSMEPRALGLSLKDTDRMPLAALPGVRGVRGVRGARALEGPADSRDTRDPLGAATSEGSPPDSRRSGGGARGVRGVAGTLLSATEAEPPPSERVLGVRCSRAGTQAPSRNTSSTTLQVLGWAAR